MIMGIHEVHNLGLGSPNCELYLFGRGTDREQGNVKDVFQLLYYNKPTIQKAKWTQWIQYNETCNVFIVHLYILVFRFLGEVYIKTLLKGSVMAKGLEAPDLEIGIDDSFIQINVTQGTKRSKRE